MLCKTAGSSQGGIARNAYRRMLAKYGCLTVQEQGGYSSDEADRGYEKPQVNGVSSAATSGQSGEEARLVDQICTPGGLRAQPTAEDLAVFVDSAGSMSGPVLAERLEDKVVSPAVSPKGY